MDLNYLPEFLSLIPLSWAFWALWRERRRFRSLLPFIIGAAFFALSRVAIVLMEHPSVRLHEWLGISHSSFDMALNIVADLADVIGIVFLVLGFVQTIKFMHAEEKQIETLRELLPICAGCKRIRADDGGSPLSFILLRQVRRL